METIELPLEQVSIKDGHVVGIDASLADTLYISTLEDDDLDDVFQNAIEPLAAALPPGPPRFTPEQQAVERLANAAIAANPPLIDPALIQSAIRAARNPEDLADRLAAIASEADPVAFRELLARSLWAADLMGYAHASG